MSAIKTAMSFFTPTTMILKRKTGHKLTILGVFFVACFTPLLGHSQERQETLTSTIVGNREQPKVLYIVPWKAVNDSELEEQTIQSQLDIVFGHVERIELQRELDFMKQIEKTAKKEQK